jgi:hypothetical protein
LQRPSSDSTFGYRAGAGVFVAATAFFVWFFVYELAKRDEIRSGIATYALLTGLTAGGLLARRSWARSLGLLLALATAGLGTLTLLTAVMARDGSFVVPAVTLVVSAGTAYLLART